MPLFLVRHGETRLSGTYCGSLNPPLNARGRAQARTAARILSRYPIHRCYASPLRRAQETAIILQRQIKQPIRTRASLREIHFGLWEGLRFQDLKKRWPDLARRWAVDPMTVRMPQGESFASLQRRVKR